MGMNLVDTLYLQFTPQKSMIQIPLPVLHRGSSNLRNSINLIICFLFLKDFMAAPSFPVTETIKKNRSSVLYTVSKTTSYPYYYPVSLLHCSVPEDREYSLSFLSSDLHTNSKNQINYFDYLLIFNRTKSNNITSQCV